MKTKQKVLILASLLGLSGVFVTAPVALAASCAGVSTSIISCNSNKNSLGTCADKSYPINGVCSAGLCSDKSIPLNGTCPRGATYTAPTLDKNGHYPKYTPPTDASGLWWLLKLARDILTAVVVVAAIAGIVWGSVLYATAGGKPEQVKKANIVIANTVLGIIVFALMYAFLNFIIPGGIFA